MLINALSLKNFKCFEEIDIDFGKITLLTGANSSGKSSLIYSILAMLQTENFPLYLSPNGKYVNLGSYEEMVMDRKKDIEIYANFYDFLQNVQVNTIWENNETGLPKLKQIGIKKENSVPDFKEIDEKFNYIGSYRLPPERTYYRKAQSSKIGISGEGYIDQIIDWEESNPDKFKELVSKLSDLQLLTEIKSSKLKGGRFEIGVKTHKHSKVASLTDVGFGISQFLPVIVADLQLPNHSCLTVSQPEIHLHPKIQATLGNYLVNQINSTDKQYLVETHSEYLLNRLRLLIAKGELKPEDIKIYYLENDGEKSISHPITFTKHGEILGAPDGFFDTYMMDVFDIALTAE